MSEPIVLSNGEKAGESFGFKIPIDADTTSDELGQMSISEDEILAVLNVYGVIKRPDAAVHHEIRLRQKLRTNRTGCFRLHQHQSRRDHLQQPLDGYARRLGLHGCRADRRGLDDVPSS